MNKITLDIETYSSADLDECGVYKYAEAPDFEILLISYSIDDGPVQVVDLACGEALPPEIRAAITDETVLKHAYNANFERVCLSRWLGLPTGTYLAPESWRCDRVRGATQSLPLSLAEAGAVLKLEQQKLKEGKALVKKFCSPCKPTKKNGSRTRILPADDPEAWALFKAYNIRDVETELAIQQRLAPFPVPDETWREYFIDQRINDCGVMIDLELVQQAISLANHSQAELMETLHGLTGLKNPNSPVQLKRWLAEHGIHTDSTDKKAVAALLKALQEFCADINLTSPSDASRRLPFPEGGLDRTLLGDPDLVARVLELHLKSAKSSVKKYETMEAAVCADGRVRGCFQFYGAVRTGRWAGRLIQLQNLPQNHIENLDEARALAKAGDLEGLKKTFGDVQDTLSQLIRTAFIAKPGTTFLVADFSAIEARVLAWYAKELWRQKVFADGGDIYCASASAMFKVPVEKHGINGHLRQKGKVAELALGYGGAVGALKSMGALEMGLQESELWPLVLAWHKANPNIIKFWNNVHAAAKEAVIGNTTRETNGLRFTCQNGLLRITLPSGRDLVYINPRMGLDSTFHEIIRYEGFDATKKWGDLETYGPKLVENIVQATARDLLCNAMKNLPDCDIVMHIHDEVVIEAPEGLQLDDVCKRMAEVPAWADGLLLRADGYETNYYKKD